MQVHRGAYIFYFNPQVRISKMLTKDNLDYHPSPSDLSSRIHCIIFLWISKGFISPEHFLNFLSNLYIPLRLQKSFKIITEFETFVSQKLNLFILTHAPKQNSSSGFHHQHSRQKKLHISKTRLFEHLFFPNRKGGRLWS